MVGLFANLMRVTLTMSALAALILFCTPLLKRDIRPAGVIGFGWSLPCVF